jgi:hypothetical protein
MLPEVQRRTRLSIDEVERSEPHRSFAMSIFSSMELAMALSAFRATSSTTISRMLRRPATQQLQRQAAS